MFENIYFNLLIWGKVYAFILTIGITGLVAYITLSITFPALANLDGYFSLNDKDKKNTKRTNSFDDAPPNVHRQRISCIKKLIPVAILTLIILFGLPTRKQLIVAYSLKQVDMYNERTEDSIYNPQEVLSLIDKAIHKVDTLLDEN